MRRQFDAGRARVTKAARRGKAGGVAVHQLGPTYCGLYDEMVKKTFQAFVSRCRIDRGRLLSAPAMSYPVAIPANLIDLLDKIGVQFFVRFQHFGETALLDAFFHLDEGMLDSHMTQR